MDKSYRLLMFIQPKATYRSREAVPVSYVFKSYCHRWHSQSHAAEAESFPPV